MKKTISIFFFVFASLCAESYAAITLNTFFGIAYDSDGIAPVPDGTLWIMIVDSNGDNVLPGGLDTESSLSLNDDVSEAAADFSNIILELGAIINGDKIFAMGGMNGTATLGQAGISFEEVELTVGLNGELANSDIGKSFGFYWFPGISYDSVNPNVQMGSVFDVGGISVVTNPDTGVDPMVIPGDGTTINVGATTEEVGGNTSVERFTAVQIPEPTTLIFALISAAALLRRRRV